MSKKQHSYSEEFKLSVLREYYASGMSKRQCIRQFGLSGIAVLNNWLAHYQVKSELVSLCPNPTDEDMANRSKEDYKNENVELKKKLRELSKALEFSRWETKARDMMIEKAEGYFDISIRKKFGAK